MLDSATNNLFCAAKFSAHANSLCTCLVHQNKEDTRNPGGAFNYFIDDAVKGGGNVTAEVIWRTLCKVQNLREIWAEVLHVQLDSTTKDSKNHSSLCLLGVARAIWQCPQGLETLFAHALCTRTKKTQETQAAHSIISLTTQSKVAGTLLWR